MNEGRRPNLFEFATSELSQDAFICWLISWANPEFTSTDPALHDTAIELLNRVFAKNEKSPPFRYESVRVEKQHQNIDVFVVVNDSIAIIIEDKTCSSEHSGQLIRYREKIRNDIKYDSDRIICIYLKTGDQSCYRAVEDAEFTPFLRSDLLDVLEYGKERGVQNQIFDDFHDRLRAIENDVESYSQVEIGKWTPGAWTGFFMALKKKFGEGDWAHYATNRTGQTVQFWWHVDDEARPKYLQLEWGKLCFMISLKDHTEYGRHWEDWYDRLAQKAPQLGIRLKPGRRPRRSVHSLQKTSTVASFVGDYRKIKDGDILDLDATVAELRRAEQLFDLAAATD